MEYLQVYAPYALFILNFLLALKLFARTDELEKLKSELMKYSMEHFVTKDIYADNHRALQEQISQMRQDVSDVKNLIISDISNRRQNI